VFTSSKSGGDFGYCPKLVLPKPKMIFAGLSHHHILGLLDKSAVKPLNLGVC